MTSTCGAAPMPTSRTASATSRSTGRARAHGLRNAREDFAESQLERSEARIRAGAFGLALRHVEPLAHLDLQRLHARERAVVRREVAALVGVVEAHLEALHFEQFAHAPRERRIAGRAIAIAQVDVILECAVQAARPRFDTVRVDEVAVPETRDFFLQTPLERRVIGTVEVRQAALHLR